MSSLKRLFFFFCFKTFNNSATSVSYSAIVQLLCLQSQVCVRFAVVPGELCHPLSGVRSGLSWQGRQGERGTAASFGLCCEEGRIAVIWECRWLFLGQSWCECLELWTKCFSSTPGRCAGTRWGGNTVCRSLSVISVLITAYTTAVCVLE